MEAYRILGLDPGLHVTGYAVLAAASGAVTVLEAGVVRSTGDDLLEKLASLHCEVAAIIDGFLPQVVAVEQLYAHYAHPRTAILMGHARGVLLLAAAQRQLPVVHYNATQVKKVIAGSGRAGKDQIQRTMQRELGLATMPEPADVADALAIALCHYHLHRASPVGA